MRLSEPTEGYNDETKGQLNGFFGFMYLWLLSIFDYIYGLFRPPQALTSSTPVTTTVGSISPNSVENHSSSTRNKFGELRDLDDNNSRKPNEYFGGDSTAYLGGDGPSS